MLNAFVKKKFLARFEEWCFAYGFTVIVLVLISRRGSRLSFFSLMTARNIKSQIRNMQGNTLPYSFEDIADGKSESNVLATC